MNSFRRDQGCNEHPQLKSGIDSADYVTAREHEEPLNSSQPARVLRVPAGGVAALAVTNHR